MDNETKAHHGYHFPGIIQVPGGLELDGKMMLQLSIDCDAAIGQGIQELKQK